MGMSQQRWRLEQERKRRERERRMKRRRSCAIIVLLGAVIAVLAIVMANNADKSTEKTNPTDAPKKEYAVDNKAAQNPYTTSRAVEDIKAAFFADSAFAGNALAESIGMYGILKDSAFYAGVGVDVDNIYTEKSGNSTTSIAEQFKSKRFKKVFLAFGENELSSMTSTEFKKSYLKLVDKIEEYQPNARIYLISIPPVSKQVSDKSDDITMKRIQEFNRRIMSIAVDEELYYIDSVDALSDNKGFLPDGVSYDGINLNKAAVVDLLYYMTKEAYIPDSDDLSETLEDRDDEEDEDEERTEKKPQSTLSPSPSPTVNVFKDKKPSRQED